MAGKRIINSSITELTTFDPTYYIALDKVGELQAKQMAITLVGNSYVQGSVDGISYHNELTALDEYFQISTDGGVTWVPLGGSSGSVTEVTSSTPNQLTVATGTSTPALSIVTQAVVDGGTGLATTNQIYDFVTGQGFLTSVSVGSTLTGNGTVGSPLSIVTTGNWSGTFDSQEGTYYLNRTNHTGTQLAATISDFQTAVSLNSDVSSSLAHITTDGSSHSFINQNVTSTGTPSFNSIQLNTGVFPSHTEGLLFYDDSKKALSYYNDESDVTINLAQELVVRVYNGTGSTILNGQVVTGLGSIGGIISIQLVNSHVKAKSRLIGVATHDIENGTVGYVTRFGDVGGLNTSIYSEGDILYLDSVDGGLTTSQPTDGGYSTIIGMVKEVHLTEGIIIVDPKISELTVEVTDTNGFPTDQRTGTTISFVDATRTFSIAPTGDEFHFYELGEKYEKTTTQSVVIDDTTGSHIVYFDEGVLTSIANPTSSQAWNIILNKCIVSYLYWNATNGAAYIVQDERHGIGMAPATHLYLHRTRGAKYLDGLAPTDIIIGNGSLASHAQFGVTTGLISDEDLDHTLNTVVSTVGLKYYYRTVIDYGESSWKFISYMLPSTSVF